MTDQNAIVISNERFLAPVADITTALHRYQAMKEFVSGVLREGIDFGKNPGSDKPTLLKPGAEKLSNFFGLNIRLPRELREKELDWTGEYHGGEPFFHFSYTAHACRGDTVVAECEASANSWEVKYRYRQAERVCPSCGKSAIIAGKPEYGGGWLCFAKKGGCGSKFKIDDERITVQQLGRVKNPDPADIVNTLQKMAQKRAIVGVTLLACNASEYFTQDLDDFVPSGPIVEGHFEEVKQGNNHPDHKAWEAWSKLVEQSKEFTTISIPALDPNNITTDELREEYKKLKTAIKEAEAARLRSIQPDSEPQSNGNGDITGKIITSAVEAGLSENEYSARQTLKRCKIEPVSVEDGLDWIRRYRGFRDLGGSPEQAAQKANEGKQP